MYGVILLVDFVAQSIFAVCNRGSVNRIANKRAGKPASRFKQPLDDGTLLCPEADVSITVVGYREADEDWRKCLRSLQQQTLRPRHLIAVVDGDAPADQEMAKAFDEELRGKSARVIHLPLLLHGLFRQTYDEALIKFEGPKMSNSRWAKFGRWLGNKQTPAEVYALAIARQRIVDQVEVWNDEFSIDRYENVCFTQPHSHKRGAMFTAFAMALWACRTRDGIFTTDSDTLLETNALDEMYCLLSSEERIGGVTAEVKISNRADSFLSRMCSVRYLSAFQLERAAQSLWRCVGCLSGPMAMYKSSSLSTILGPWALQTFMGKETTFGDDRHLSNQLLVHGYYTRYTHRTFCESESPATFVRWVKQQTR
jgi:hyaluronan synthase